MKKEIRTIIKMTLEALEKSIEFIEENTLEHPNRIDYITYMTGLFVYMEDKEMSYNQKKCLIEWYNTVEFSKKDNGERRKIFEDLIKIKDMN